MRIGSVPTTDNTQVTGPTRTLQTPNLGPGISAALRNFGGTLGEAAVSFDQLAQNQADLEKAKKLQMSNVDFIRRQGEWTRQVQDMKNNAPIGAPDFTEQVHGSLRQQTEDFLSTIEDEDIRERFRERTEAFVQNSTTAAFGFEFDEGNRAFGKEVVDLLDDARTRLREEPGRLSEEMQTFQSLINTSTLPAPERQALSEQVLISLQSTEFQMQMELAQDNMAPVREADGSDVVAPGVPSGWRGFLNVTASKEADTYNRLHGGGEFADYTDHPRVRMPVKGTDKVSTAAGRYQFLAGTWDFVVENMKAEGYDFGNEEFSPVNQDRAAIWYAQHRYNQQARREGLPQEWQDINTILRSGDRAGLAQVRRILGGTDGQGVVWEGLQNIGDDAFANFILGGRGRIGDATGDSPAPDAWDEEKYPDLTFDTRVDLEMAAVEAVAEGRRARTEQRVREEQALADQLERMIQDDPAQAFPAVQAALDSNAISNTDLRDSLIKGVAEQQQLADYAAEISATLNLKGPKSRSARPEDGEKVDALFKTNGLQNGLREGDEAAARDLVNIFGRLEVVPTETVALLEQQLTSSNPQQQAFGYSTLTAMYDKNPEAFMRGVSEETARRAAWYSTTARYTQNPQEALARLNVLQSPESATARAQLQTAAKETLEDFSDGDTLKTVTSFWQRNLPEFLTGATAAKLPAQAQQSQLFQSDYRKLYEQHFVMMNGNEEMAHELTGQMMGYSWAVDPLGGNLMKYSPVALGNTVPRINDSYDWIDTTVREVTGLDSTAPAALVFDQQTEQEIRAGRVPSYLVLTEEEFGDSGISVPSIVRGPNNLPLRVPMEPTPAIRAKLQKEALLINLKEKEQRRLKQLQKERQDIRRQNVIEGGFGLEAPVDNDPELEKLRRRIKDAEDLQDIPDFYGP